MLRSHIRCRIPETYNILNGITVDLDTHFFIVVVRNLARITLAAGVLEPLLWHLVTGISTTEQKWPARRTS